MKCKLVVTLCLLIAQSVQAQYEHIPPCNGNHHTDHAICYGFAIGRAFGKLPNDASCDPMTLDFAAILLEYFDKDISTTVVPGRILAFEEGNPGVYGHFAFVNENSNIDQVNNNGSAVPQMNIPLELVIEGDIAQNITPRGEPVASFVRRKRWSLVGLNTLDGSTSAGGLLKVGGSDIPSGANVAGLAWGNPISVEAIWNQHEDPNGLQWALSSWSGWAGAASSGSEQAVSVPINWAFTSIPSIKARFRKMLRIQNTKIVPYGESLIVDGEVELIVEQNSELIVYGRLEIVGTPAQHRTLGPSVGTWGGIRFVGSGTDGSELQYCDIIHATSPIVATNVNDLEIDNVTISGSSFGGDAALRFYNSSPIIRNTRILGQSNSSNGVRFASYSSGSISNSMLQDCGAGNGIVVQGGSSPTISSNTIQNNRYHGIILVSNDLEELPVNISGNTVVDNGLVGGVKTYCGIDAYDSEADLRNNTISGSNYGVYSDTYGHVYGDNGTWWEGRNSISNNNVGLAAYNTSSIMLGEDVQPDGYGWGHYPGGCNEITGNTYHVISNLATEVYAMGNWWGPSPDPTKFSEAAGGKIYYLPMMSESQTCLYEEPEGGSGALPEEIAVRERETALARASRALHERNLSLARDLFEYVYSNSSGGLKRSALYGLYRATKLTSHKTAKDLVAPIAASNGEFSDLAEDLLLDLHTSIGDFASTRLLANSIAERFPRTERAKHALVKLASLKAYDRTQSTVSDAALVRLQEEFTGSVDGGLLAALGTSPELQIGHSTNTTERSEGPTVAVYPNPFNPSTEVRFELQRPGDVRVEVFDLLGRSVEVLVSAAMPAGQHSVTWKGGQFPSGLYLLRCTVGGKATVMKMALAK